MAPGVGRPRHLDVFRGLGLVAILCWQAIRIVAGKVGRAIEAWIRSDWHDFEDEESPGTDTWKCERCGKIGMGDATSFFSLAEIDHFLDTRCKGSLRRHTVPELAAASHVQEESRAPAQVTTCLSRTSPPSFAQGTVQESLIIRRPGSWFPPMENESIAIGYNAWLATPAPPSEQEADHQVALGLGSTWVEAGQTLFINAGTRETFQVMRLIVPSSSAEHFMIEGLTIGQRQLLPSRVPAILFTETCTEITFFDGKVEPPGLITVSVTNMSRKGRWFQGAVMGPTMGDSTNARSATAAYARELMLRRVEEGFVLRGGSAIAAQELDAVLGETKS